MEMEGKGNPMGKGTEMGKCSWEKGNWVWHPCKAIDIVGWKAINVGEDHT